MEDNQEKEAALQEAESKTIYEQQRLDYYLSLRYDFQGRSVNQWLHKLYDDERSVYKPLKSPSWNQVRREAGISLWENIVANFSTSKKKEVEDKKELTRSHLQEEIDKENERRKNKCEESDALLRDKISNIFFFFFSNQRKEVEQYFSYVLYSDNLIFDGTQFDIDFHLAYDESKKCLVADYKLPMMSQIPQTKKWTVNKNNEIKEQLMNKSDYISMYERIIFDVSLRAVGVLFESDSNNLLTSIVFNGSCVFNEWQKMPTILLSFAIQKNQYSYDRVRRMDFVSKREIAKLPEVAYLDDIHSDKPPADLWETPPSKIVTPIRSSQF